MTTTNKEGTIMNRVLAGFVWRQIPALSQFKLEKDYCSEDKFVPWSQRIIEDYERRCTLAAEDCRRSVELLKSLGCQQVVVSPDAVGSMRLVLFDRLLAELPKHSLLMVTSWGDFGGESMVLDCVDRALAKSVYVITEQHLSLQYLPLDHLDEAYRSLVQPQITGGFRVRLSRKDQITDLLAQGLTATEVQERLKISKSTYYRLMADGTVKILATVLRDFDNELNRLQ
jgi:hypothetical protein